MQAIGARKKKRKDKDKKTIGQIPVLFKDAADAGKKLWERMLLTFAGGMIPRTVQETLPYERMYADGICLVRGDYYTSMVEFTDTNYILLDDRDQEGIQNAYADFLNYFDPSIHVQLLMFNRRVSEKVLKQQIQIPEQDGDLKEIRDEVDQIIRKNAAKGTNGVVKSKYVVFGIHADSYKEARSRLGRIEADVIKYLENTGASVYPMERKERLEVLHSYFNQDTVTPFLFTEEEFKKGGRSTKDYVAPSGFDFRNPFRFVCGQMYGCAFYVKIMDSTFTDTTLKQILDLDDNITVSMHMDMLSPVDAGKMLRQKLTSVQSSKIDAQKKASMGGYDIDIVSPAITTSEKDLEWQIQMLNESNEKVIDLSMLICCFGKSKRDVENLRQSVAGILEIVSCNLMVLQYQQEAGLMAAAPLGINDTGILRNMTTEAMRVLLPFNTQELFQNGQAIYYGMNSLTNNLIMLNRKYLRNPNGLIIGSPGSGKSFLIKEEIMLTMLMTKDDILICDPEGEYFPVVERLGGQVIRLSTTSKDYINPLDIQLIHQNDEEAWKIKADFVITLINLIAGGKHELEADEEGIVDKCVSQIYREYFKDPVPEKMPILSDLHAALLKHPNHKAKRIADCLEIYVNGSMNYFNHRTNVDTSNRLLDFDVKDMPSKMRDISMLIIQDAVWNRVSINRELRKTTRYYCDEFHLLLADPKTAAYCVEIWKRFRKWGGIPTGITQNIGDFFKSPQVEGIISNSDFKCLLNIGARDLAQIQESLKLSERQLKCIMNAEQGSGLIIFDKIVIPFVNRYPKDTITYKLMTTKMEEAVMRSDQDNES